MCDTVEQAIDIYTTPFFLIYEKVPLILIVITFLMIVNRYGFQRCTEWMGYYTIVLVYMRAIEKISCSYASSWDS